MNTRFSPKTVIDTETGGLHARARFDGDGNPIHLASGLCSIAAMSPDGHEFYTLIQPSPGLVYNSDAMALNGFTLDQLQREGVPETEAISGLVSFIKSHCGDSFVAGCNVGFDVGFIQAAADRCGGPDEQFLERKFLRNCYELQTAAIRAHEDGIITLPPKYAGSELPSVKLDHILGAFGLTRQGDTHGALEDVRLTARAIVEVENATAAARQSAIGNAPDIAAGMPNPETPAGDLQGTQTDRLVR